MAKLVEENVEKKPVNLDEAVQLTGYGIFNIIILLASGGGLMCVIIETMSMMFIMPAAQCDLHLTLTTKGILSSISFFGVVSSSHMWGYIADTKGRRTVLLLSLSISGISTLICCFVPSDWLFIILRFINGFFIGGASSSVYTYLGEFHDAYYRPKAISWMSTFVAFGNIYLPGIAWLILPGAWSFDIFIINFRPWRLLLIIYVLPSILVTIIFTFLPESPKFLITKGQHDKALKILQKMYAINNKKNPNSYPVSEITYDKWESLSNKQCGILESVWKQTVPLFQGKYLAKTAMMSYLQFGVFVCTSGIMMWYPEILNRMSHYLQDYPGEDVGFCDAFLEESHPTHFNNSMESARLLCTDAVKPDVFLVTILVAVAYALVFVVIGIVINKFGKKPLMVFVFTTTTMCGLGAQFTTGYATIQILVGMFLMGGTGISLSNAIAVDLFPTQLRGMAMALSLMFGRIGAVVGTNIVGPILYNICDYLFVIAAGNSIVLIIVVLCLPT